MPATCSRRPWDAVVRGRPEPSIRNAATASRRHGFMAPMRDLRAVVATHEPERRALLGRSERTSQSRATLGAPLWFKDLYRAHLEAGVRQRGNLESNSQGISAVGRLDSKPLLSGLRQAANAA